jgi:hypothetical protein
VTLYSKGFAGMPILPVSIDSLTIDKQCLYTIIRPQMKYLVVVWEKCPMSAKR